MKILVPTTVLPSRGLTSNAAPIVIRELVGELASLGHEVEVLPIIFGKNIIDLPPTTKDAIDELEGKGIKFHTPIILSYSPFSGGRYSESISVRLFSEIIFSLDVFLYPVLKNKNELYSMLDKMNFDCLLVLWSEPITILLSDYPRRKIAYYGNPDPKSFLANLNFIKRQGGRFSRYILGRSVLPFLESRHQKFMRKWDALANVAKNDSQYYARAGHPRSFYVQNTWMSRYEVPSKVPVKRGPIIRIIASVGKLNGTANSHGFEYLLNELLPQLRSVLADDPFELHVFGTGEPHPTLRELWKQPEVKRRGFVDDLDSEIARADFFLILNNATEFNVCHTRYLHAWSIGSCLVGHSNVRLAMPEFRHGENCLLGQDAAEIASMIKKARSDDDLRTYLVREGRRTHYDFFTPRVVARKLESLVTNLTLKQEKI